MCTLFELYLPNEGFYPALNPVHLPDRMQKVGNCLFVAPDLFTSKFNERRNKKLSRSHWQSAANKRFPPLPSSIPASPQQHPSPEPSHQSCGVLAWDGHKEEGQDQRREMFGFKDTLLQAGALLFFSCLLCISIS